MRVSDEMIEAILTGQTVPEIVSEVAGKRFEPRDRGQVMAHRGGTGIGKEPRNVRRDAILSTRSRQKIRSLDAKIAAQKKSGRPATVMHPTQPERQNLPPSMSTPSYAKPSMPKEKNPHVVKYHQH